MLEWNEDLVQNYGLKIRYPRDWDLDKKQTHWGGGGVDVVILPPNGGSYDLPYGSQVTISISETQYFETLDEHYAAEKEAILGNHTKKNIQVLSEKELFFLNRRGLELLYQFDGDSGQKIMAFHRITIDNAILYMFTFEADVESFHKNRYIAELIFESLDFR